ncbi:MAG: hypothetical protein JNN01_03475 [Opitutaceae bacterium]|nr:hypothetical protein [Opitutaceae bacterium]
MKRRVKITGIGPVTPAGTGRDEFWSGILESTSRIRPFLKLGEEWGPFVAAWVDRLPLDEHFTPFPALRTAARHTQMAVLGAALAVKDAGLTFDDVRAMRVAVFTGTSLMDFGAITRETESVAKSGIRGIQSKLVFVSSVAHVAATVSEALKISSRNMTFQSSCCSGLDAIGHAADAVSSGEVDIAICGGTEAPLYKHPMLEFRAVGMTPPTDQNHLTISRPFDLWRTTGIVSEGACMFIVEPDDSPRPGYCSLVGYGYSNDERGELCDGMQSAIKLALSNARVRESAIDSISAWGPGHRLIDAAEAKQLRGVFGDELDRIPAYSIKGSIGNPLGAAAAIQVAAAALGLRDQIVPPTVNWKYPDPDCRLNLCAAPVAVAQRFSLVNSHGVNGTNSTLILERSL